MRAGITAGTTCGTGNQRHHRYGRCPSPLLPRRQYLIVTIATAVTSAVAAAVSSAVTIAAMTTAQQAFKYSHRVLPFA